MDFTTMSAEERAEAISKMTPEALTAALTEMRDKATALFALDSPTIAQVDEAEALVASVKAVEKEQGVREKAASDAAARFAAAKQTFAINDGVESSDDADEDEDAEESEEDEDGDESEVEDGDDDGETVEAAAGAEKGKKGENPFPPKKKKDPEAEADDDEEKDAVTTASARGATKVKPGSTAKKVGRRTTRPAKASTPDLVITAAADVPDFATGARMNGLDDLAKGLIGRAGGFAPHNERAAMQVREATGRSEVLHKFGLARLGHNFDSALVASGGPDGEYRTAKDAIKSYKDALVASIEDTNAGKQGADGTLTAAGWCAPSEVSYTWLADYQVSGLLSLPEVDAKRGGLMMTTGPALADNYAMDGSDFGFGGTEAQAEAGYVKTCETIVCPDFVDHRLDFVGYCWKFPLLTEAAFPELVKDALRLSSVLYAHRLNSRRIDDITALSVVSTLNGLGASFTDTLEALSILAVKERRRLNLAETAVMEVKMPTFAKEVFRADVSRRMNQPLGAISDQQINAEFTARRLAPEYLSDMQDLLGDDAVFPATFDVLIYPAGTFVNAMKDVINLQAVYDAASLSVNEYTGVFFEQGFKVIQAGYKSHRMTVPICTAGLVGAAVLDCDADTLNTEGPDADAA